MNHLNQEEIVMAYYGETDAAWSEHLAGCDTCRTELGRIAMVLDRVPAIDVPEPDADYESRVWERVRWRLRGEKKRARIPWTRWAAAAAMFAFAFVSGLLWNRRNAVVTQPGDVGRGLATPVASTPQQRDRILLVVVGNHLDQSERILIELTNLQPEEGVDISAERERAQALLASNRLYRRTAEDRDQENVATLLEDLEPMLLQIAHAPSQMSADELRTIQKRIESKGLVMKLRVVRANVRGASTAQLQQPNV